MTSPRGSRREYPREARVAELLREILGTAIDRIDDGRLEGVVVTGVDVERELRSAVVWFDSDGPDDAVAALGEHRAGLQSAINDQAHLRRTPVLEFRSDESISTGNRIEEILSGLDIPAAGDADPAATGASEDDPDAAIGAGEDDPDAAIGASEHDPGAERDVR